MPTKTETEIARSEQYIMNTYKRFPIVLVRGEGARVWDVDGREYLDFIAGIAVCNLGHCHPAVVEAIRTQAGELLHVSNLYHIAPQIRMAQLLVENTFADKVFFCNSGAEANEGAIKLARKYAHAKMGAHKRELITMEGSFHGRTLATVTATAQTKFQAGFEPLPEGFRYVPYNDPGALEKAITRETYAVMLEPIQGEKGVRIPAEGYLAEARRICDRHGILLILDEVQTGMGRTGTFCAHETTGIKPDIMTLAKGLANGVPSGAVLATAEVASAFVPGSHASTFGGNPLAMAAAVATFETIQREGVLSNCRRIGAYFLERLQRLAAKHAKTVRAVRGRGLLIGLELSIEGAEIVQRCLERGLLLNCTDGNVLRFAPPLVIGEAEVDRAVDIVHGVMD
ncbi:MAG: Acetylornithine aminotransferase [Syntrophaceae bacterium PtaU1.Bin231]|nr:MAG: Acetylornithine aminotransferase [Syntrophaceae bacterium PtaU1.Bin231]HOG16481.1 acetylornithine transaminase [Syntrophales bacterium]